MYFVFVGFGESFWLSDIRFSMVDFEDSCFRLSFQCIGMLEIKLE